MANNRMFLVNDKTGAKVYIAKYYPGTGWFCMKGAADRINAAFDDSDFGHLTPEQRAKKRDFMSPGSEGLYANYDAKHLMLGDQWRLEYEQRTDANA